LTSFSLAKALRGDILLSGGYGKLLPFLTTQPEFLKAKMRIALAFLLAAVVLFPLSAGDYTATRRMMLVK
jgi:hypothetical protein